MTRSEARRVARGDVAWGEAGAAGGHSIRAHAIPTPGAMSNSLFLALETRQSLRRACDRLPHMPLILILVILLLAFGGGGYYMGPGVGYYGGGGVSIILAIVIIYLLFGRGRGRI
jgi:hypothetical protein